MPDKLVKRVLDTELQHHGMKRRASIYNEINKIFREDWRSIEEITADVDGEEPEQWEYNDSYEEIMQ